MAKKPRTPADVGSIFDHFRESGRFGDPDPDPTPAAPPAADDQLARIQATLERLEQENRDLRERLYRPDPSPAPAVPPPQPKFDLQGLPDPVQDLDGFRRDLETRVNGYVQHATATSVQQVREETSSATEAERLWAEFQRNYPDWAKYEELTSSVASQLVNRVKARGGDPKKYLFQDSKTFYSDLDRELRSKYGALLTPEEAEEEDERRAADLMGEDDGRTAGLFGGQESGGRPSAPKPGQESGDMVKDLQDLQRKTGFF